MTGTTLRGEEAFNRTATLNADHALPECSLYGQMLKREQHRASIEQEDAMEGNYAKFEQVTSKES